MTLIELFELCDNLNTGTQIIVRSGYLEEYIDEGSYPEMAALYGDKKITGFMINDLRHATIVIDRGFDE